MAEARRAAQERREAEAQRAATRRAAAAEARTTRRAARTGGRTSGAQAAAAEAAYGRAVRSRVAQAFGRQGARGRGRAVVRFTIGRNGAVSGVTLVESSGDRGIDRAALAALNTRFPAFPASVTRASLSFAIPLRVQ